MVRNLNILFAILFGAFSMQLFAAPAKQNNSSDTLSARQKYLVNSTRSIIDNNNLGRYSESINLMMEVEASIDTIDFAPYWTNTGNTQFSLMNYLGAAQPHCPAIVPPHPWSNVLSAACSLRTNMRRPSSPGTYPLFASL